MNAADYAPSALRPDFAALPLRRGRRALSLILVYTMTVTGASAQTASKPESIPDRATLIARAEGAQKAGRNADALRLFLLAGDKYQSARAYLEAARLLRAAGNHAGALEAVTKAREIAPNAEDVLSAYAQLALATKQLLPAAFTLLALTRMHPTVALYHYLLGVALLGMGDLPGATDSLAEANRLEPDRTMTLLAIGLVSNNRKLYPEAKTVLTRCLELQPDSLEATAALAEAEAGLGNADAAVLHAQSVLASSAGNPTANLVLGVVLKDQQKYPEARDRLLKALAADPDAPKVAYQLSLVYARMGDDANAKKYLAIYQEKLRGFEDKLKILRSGG
jgi:tetratricopeptide (TPR) repeat protein